VSEISKKCNLSNQELYDAFTEKRKSKYLDKLLFDVQYNNLLEEEFSDEITCVIGKIIEHEFFLRSNESVKLIVFLGNQFDKLNPKQIDKLLSTLLRISTKVRSNLLQHAIGDFVANNLPFDESIKFCDALMDKFKQQEYEDTIPIFRILSSLVFCMQKEVGHLTSIQLSKYNLLVKFLETQVNGGH